MIFYYSSNSIRIELHSTNFASLACMDLIFPSLPDLIKCSIFIASSEMRLSPFLTMSPTLTNIFPTVEGMGDFIEALYEDSVSSVIP